MIKWLFEVIQKYSVFVVFGLVLGLTKIPEYFGITLIVIVIFVFSLWVHSRFLIEKEIREILDFAEKAMNEDGIEYSVALKKKLNKYKSKKS